MRKQTEVKPGVSIIGVGRLGGALALGLGQKGYRICSVVARHLSTAENIALKIEPRPQFLAGGDWENMSPGEIVFIAVPDSRIREIADELAESESFQKAKPLVLHTSGALSSEVLEALSAIGCRVGSFHPLVSVSAAELGMERFRGAFFCLEGEREAVSAAEMIVADLGGKSFSISGNDKSLYHAAAVMTAGHFVALFDLANEMLVKCGLDKAQAKAVLLPLAQSAVENLALQTNAQALTGTFARADVETMGNHLQTIQANTSESVLAVYVAVGHHALKLAAEQGANPERLGEMKKLLDEFSGFE
jgi:predicted short-subunit dehydrogenase-like oxidoreductase (DUF2520 family)